MIWKAELEMLNSSNLCSKQSKEFNFACANVHGLKANTTYLFQVQTFNFKFNSDESQSGSWSSEFEAKTDPDPNEITTRSPKNPEVIKAVDTKYVEASGDKNYYSKLKTSRQIKKINHVLNPSTYPRSVFGVLSIYIFGGNLKTKPEKS